MNLWRYAILNKETMQRTPIRLGFEIKLNSQGKPEGTGKKLTIESIVSALKPNEALIRFKENARETQYFSGNAQMRQWSILA